MTTDPALTGLRAAATHATLFYQMGAAGAARVPAPQVDVAPGLVRDRASGDRLALSGVARWMSNLGERSADESAARGEAASRAVIESRVRRLFAAEMGGDVAASAVYGPGGPDDRRQRSPYAGSADAAFHDFADAARPRAALRGGAADASLAASDGGFMVRRGTDMARVSGAAVRMLALYGDAAGAALAA